MQQDRTRNVHCTATVADAAATAEAVMLTWTIDIFDSIN